MARSCTTCSLWPTKAESGSRPTPMRSRPSPQSSESSPVPTGTSERSGICTESFSADTRTCKSHLDHPNCAATDSQATYLDRLWRVSASGALCTKLIIRFRGSPVEKGLPVDCESGLLPPDHPLISRVTPRFDMTRLRSESCTSHCSSPRLSGKLSSSPQPEHVLRPETSKMPPRLGSKSDREPLLSRRTSKFLLLPPRRRTSRRSERLDRIYTPA